MFEQSWFPGARRGLVGLCALASACTLAEARSDGPRSNQAPVVDARAQRGIEISPVPLNMNGKDAQTIGLGSYLVNALSGCNDCHTCPSYQPGHNPFKGGDGAINPTHYLGGGTPIQADLTAPNITPDDSGKPAGLSFEEFRELMLTGRMPEHHDEGNGHEAGHEHEHGGHILKAMPWPAYRHMTDTDLRAIYEYLSAIPHAEPGSGCSAPSQ